MSKVMTMTGGRSQSTRPAAPVLLAVIARRMTSTTAAANAAWEGWKRDRENMEVLHAYNRHLRRAWVLREAGAAVIMGVAETIFETANTQAIELGMGGAR